MLSFFKILPRKSAEGWRKWVTTFNQLASGVKYDAVPGHSNDSNQTPITVQLALWLEEPCASGFPTIPLLIYLFCLAACVSVFFFIMWNTSPLIVNSVSVWSSKISVRNGIVSEQSLNLIMKPKRKKFNSYQFSWYYVRWPLFSS